MTEKITSKQETKIYVESFIPDAISRIMETYNEFMKAENVSELMMKETEKVKEFVEFHKAVKAALSNIEGLLKFYKWVEENEDLIGSDDEDIRLKIKKAQDNIVTDLSKIRLKTGKS
jgi:hypothetical protein